MSFDISLDLYKIFCTVVRTGNMSVAAKELYITQPAVSMSIKQLEAKMGNPLLLRSSKGIIPTTEGSILYEYLRQALSLVDMAEKKYTEMANLQIGEIKIGASDTILSNFLTPFIKKFIRLYPEINIKITNKTTYETLKLLKSGLVDVGFVNLPIEEDSTIEITECIPIRDCIVGGSKYRELQNVGIKLEDISKYPLMALEQESNSRKYFDKFTQGQGFFIQPNIELASHDLLVKFAKINLGLALVIKEFTAMEINNKEIYEIPLIPSIPQRYIGLVKLRHVGLSYAGSKFVDLCL